MYELQANRELGPLDQMFKPYYWCYLLCFPLHAERVGLVREALSTSLEALTAEYPYLTSTVKRLDNSPTGRGQIHLESPQSPRKPHFTIVDLANGHPEWTATYQQLKAENFPLRRLDSRILAPLTSGEQTTRDVMAVQANFIDGGLIVAMCFHHNFVDGSGAARIIARLSEHFAGTAVAAGAADEMPDVLKYHTIQADYSFDDIKDEDTLWRLNCLDPKPRPSTEDVYQWPEVISALPPSRDPPVRSSMYAISPVSLAKIKAAARPEDSSTWVSTNDALVAFLWRHIIRARYPWSRNGPGNGNTDLPSAAIVALNGRKDLQVPNSYIGNCVFHCYADLTVDTVGNESTKLSELAGKIRQSVGAARNPQLLKRVIGLAATIPDVSTVRYGNDNLGIDVYTTSWAALPFYSLDWGVLGKVEYLRVPDRHFETLCCILPPRDGTIEVILSLREEDSLRLHEDGEFMALAQPI